MVLTGAHAMSMMSTMSHDEQEGFPLVYNGSAFPLRKAFVFNSKFYLSNKLEVTTIDFSLTIVSCLQNNPTPLPQSGIG